MDQEDNVAVKRLKNTTPTIINIIPNILPPNDTGKSFPYPTVVTVLTTYHTASGGCLNLVG